MAFLVQEAAFIPALFHYPRKDMLVVTARCLEALWVKKTNRQFWHTASVLLAFRTLCARLGDRLAREGNMV